MDFQTFHLLYRCSREFSHRRLRGLDLSETECMLCSYVFSHAGCSQDEVAVGLKIDKTTVAKALATLEKKGCLLREPDPADKRKNRLSLSAQGGKKVADLADLHERWLSGVLQCLSPEEQAQFESYCARLLAAAEDLSQKNGGNTNAR